MTPGWSPQYSSLWDLGSLISALPAPPTPTPQSSRTPRYLPTLVPFTSLTRTRPPSSPPPSYGTRELGTCEHLCWTHSWPLQIQVRGHPQSGATVTRPASLACDRLGPHWVCSPQTPLLGGSEAELLPRLLRSVSTQRRCAPVTSAPRHPGHVLVGASAAGSSFPGEPGTTRAWRHEEAGM